MVETWHNLPDDHPDADMPLSDFLGMTMQEYAVWTATGIIPEHLAGEQVETPGLNSSL